MEFRTGVVSLIILAGILTITPYGVFDASVRPVPETAVEVNRETLTGLRSGSYTGAAAGGSAGIGRAPDCRHCATRGAGIRRPATE